MRIICTGILFFLSFGLTAQSNWLVSFGNLVHEEILDAEKDASGNIISVGYLSGPTTIGTTNLNSNGNSDILIIKTDNAGNVIWATKAGGIGPDRAYAVDVDDNGNIYITGYFYNAATFDTISLTGQDRDVFVAKINPSGNFLWVKNCGGEFGDTGYGVAVDNSGNVLVTGQFRGNGVFGADNFLSTTDPNTSQPAYDFFLSKLDGGGNFLWTREANAKYDDRGMSVTVDELNNIYVAGQFSDTITFQNTHNNQAMNAGFVIKYDASRK
ncbi:MAG: SBBP repeat-containing protein [Crocinitomicaceae bacterium]|nr:SBBP repeat-containing protein [Crocinitomicaceae bacterium]